MTVKNHNLLPVVNSILGDVSHTTLSGIRIPKDKFLMWINILRRQHVDHPRVFLQLGYLGVEFLKHHAVFVSDQFLIFAAVGLSAAKIGELLSTVEVETKVASMFVQKYKSEATNPSISGAFARPSSHGGSQITKTAPQPDDNQLCDVTITVDPDQATDRLVPEDKEPPQSLAGSEQDATVVTSVDYEEDISTEPTQTYPIDKADSREETRVDRTPHRIRRRNIKKTQS